MPSALLFPRARPAAVVAAIPCAVLLGACSSGDGDPEGAAASSSARTSETSAASSSSAAAEPSEEPSALAGGLLPADAFGKMATVIPLSREQLRQSAGLAADPSQLDVSPEACTAVLTRTQPPIDDYQDVAAQSATVGATTTVEVLLQGSDSEDAVGTLTDAVEACPKATITSPELGEATVTFEDLGAPAAGDGAAAVRYTTTLTQGGQEVSIPALVGLVQDGDRLITLLTIATDGSDPDAAAFTSLVEQAFEVQAEELD